MAEKKLIFTLVILSICFANVFCDNILYLATVASPSHYIWNRVLAFELAERGHNVTMLGHDMDKEQVPNNFHLILLEGLYEYLEDTFDLSGIGKDGILNEISQIFEWGETVCKYDLKTKGLETLLNYPKDFKFDVILMDYMPQICIYPIIDRFGRPPVIALTAFLLIPFTRYEFGCNLDTSYFPYYITRFSDQMSFLERIANTFLVYYESLYKWYIYMPRQQALIKERFGEHIRDLEEMEKDISLLLINIDPVLDYPVSLPPNIVTVGGLHIGPAKPLPKDFQETMDNSTNGVVIFSLGTNIRSDHLSTITRDAILDTFAKLPYTVIWKFESDLENLPQNVKVSKWLPQSDILAHPNTKLFIGHGGGLSTQEAMYHGIPMVGMPFFADQNLVMGRISKRKLGTSYDFRNFHAETFYNVINETLENPIYRQNMKLISKKFKAQQQTPLQRAVYWVEYVLKHGSPNHLNLGSRSMPFYQRNNLDIMLFVCLMVYVNIRLLKKVYMLLQVSMKNNKTKTE